MGKRLDEYAPLEQSILALLRAVVHIKAVINQLYIHSYLELDAERKELIDENLRQLDSAVDGALQSLESSAGAADRVD